MGRILGDHMVLFREVDVASSPWLITNRSSVSLMILSPTSPCLCSAHCLINLRTLLSQIFSPHNCARIHFTIAVISSLFKSGTVQNCSSHFQFLAFKKSSEFYQHWHDRASLNSLHVLACCFTNLYFCSSFESYEVYLPFDVRTVTLF